MDQIVKLLDALGRLASVLIWPTVVVLVVWWLHQPISTFLSNLSEGTFKGFGIEAVLKARSEVAANLASAETDRAGSNPDNASPKVVAGTVSQSFRSADNLVSVATLRKLGTKQVLWVDDNPANNFYERRAIEALGVRIISARSTDEALGLLGTSGQGYDAVISDMGRPEGDRAGYDLLAQIKAKGINKPFIIYARSNTAAQAQEAKQNGAFGSTNSPAELLNLVVTALT